MDEETLTLFRAEAGALVESLETSLLALKDRPNDRELIDSAFRDLHTLKGTGAMFGRADVASFLHDFETAFDRVRDGSMAVTPELVALSLSARDHVADLLRAGEPVAQDPAGQEILARLAALTDGAVPAPSAGPGPEPQGAWQVSFTLPPDTLALGGRPELVLEELRRIGARRIRARVAGIPPLEEIDPENLYLSWVAEIDASVTEDEIRGAFLFHEDGLDLRIEPPAPPSDGETSAAGPPEPKPALAPQRGTSLMRVPAERLDEMMDRVGELVIAEARLADLAARSRDPALMSVAEDIQRLATGMRDNTMSIRMTPIGAITPRFRRLVHDVSADLGKPLTLDLRGEETELDKTVIDRLTDPLMHLIRNAADHGLENTETRRALGKPETGRITLSAGYSGAEVLVTLSDDGGGIDRSRVRARAIERGLIPESVPENDEGLLKLIFEPGFSTAETVTKLSGRGVGMDVVRRSIEELRGTIDVASEAGRGTTITLRLPLTLAIIDGLLIEIGSERFVVPLAAVDEIVELPERHRDGESGNAFLDIRTSLVPFLRLRSLLRATGDPDPHQKVVIVTSGDDRIGLVVDRIVGNHQTVIKQLSPLHSGLKSFSGATLLGDGAVALILDVPNLVARGRGLAEETVEAA
ncbi:chemotaxis protein CheA [Histidinibacterium aquaticum]|nr:chemotaxis protein CheA [Histidinibacterium aquaticum]